MKNIEKELQADLLIRKKENAFRTLQVVEGKVDFCSNDYLGFARIADRKRNSESLGLSGFGGSTGSRLITGHNKLFEELERFISNFHSSEDALIFNSGYDANLGLFSCIAKRGDTIIYDSLIHASIRDGIRLSGARSFSFQHNNIEDLRKKIENSEGTIFCAVESVYSMDGDEAPLVAISTLCKQFNVNLIVDEAHALGVFGDRGEGRVVELGIEDQMFARLVTFGKALGCHGAAVLGSEILKQYLINFSRPFIYTTALPKHSLAQIILNYQRLINEKEHRANLKELIAYFKLVLKEKVGIDYIESNSAIQCILISGNDKVKEVASKMQKNGLDVRPILHPTVPKGKERIRICLHAFNSKKEIDKLFESL